jgi:L-lactate dehydrogenase complex protein LldG
MVSDKVAALKATGASQMVTADCGCMLNITQRAAREDQDAGRASLRCRASTWPPSCSAAPEESTHERPRPHPRQAARRQPAQAVPCPTSRPLRARARGESKAERLARFRTGIEGFHAEVHVTTEADWPALLARLCADKGGSMFGAQPRPAAAPDRRRLRTHAAPVGRPGGRHQGRPVPPGGRRLHPGPRRHRRNRQPDLWSSADEPRTLSLVPPIHFALLDAATIHPTFYDALVSENWAAGLPTNALLISGPSKTADIQQTLAYGAHGPKERS